MKKLKLIAIALVVLGLLTALILYMIPWGTAESEVKVLEITEESKKVESQAGVEINDISELSGVYTTYDIDSATSELMFSVDALQGTIGKFKKFSVEYLAGTTMEESKIKVDIDVNSVYTANGMRDESLRDEGFFEVVKYPSIQFESKSIEVVDTGYVAIGDLTMMGLSKELSFPFSYKGKSKNDKGEEVAIFEGEFSINRVEYGMEHTASVGDDVSVNFIVQLAK